MLLLKSNLHLLLIGIVTTFMVACDSAPTETTEDTSSADTTTAVTPPPPSARPVHWSYAAESGPANWGTLSPTYALCGSGQAQSPINIVKSDAKGKAMWKFDHKTTSLKIAHTEHMDDILDNGHTIQVSVDEGSTFTFGDKTYNLKQFHFHTPSEHTVDGKHMPMEMHMVHQGADGSLAVVSVMFKEGKTENENLAKIIANLPAAKGETNHVADAKLDLSTHLPKDNYAYYYTGSLTTPPCSESVQWLVLRDLVSVTPDQIKAISSRIGPNNRPVQALNGREINVADLVGKETK
jgi:carbonic anhydrase